jgi:hypothetical protein
MKGKKKRVIRKKRKKERKRYKVRWIGSPNCRLLKPFWGSEGV